MLNLPQTRHRIAPLGPSIHKPLGCLFLWSLNTIAKCKWGPGENKIKYIYFTETLQYTAPQ